MAVAVAHRVGSTAHAHTKSTGRSVGSSKSQPETSAPPSRTCWISSRSQDRYGSPGHEQHPSFPRHCESAPLLSSFPMKTQTRIHGIFIGLMLLCLAGLTPLKAQLLPHTPFQADPKQLTYLKRTLSLLNSASPSNKITFRIMVYGQSISVGPWSDILFDKLRASYPDVTFVTTNKAIGGFTAALLSRSAIPDVGPWQPDLVLLHCLGNDIKDYDRLYRAIKSRCTADVLVQADHIQSTTQANESIDISEIGPDSIWVLRNYYWLPELANQFGFCWADIRTPWKQYLSENNLAFSDLLEVDRIHCNEHGFYLTAELLYEFLKPRTITDPLDPFNCDRIQTRASANSLKWVGDAWEADVFGNRVDIIYNSNASTNAPTYKYTVDDQPPSQIAEFFDFDRASPAWAISWPGILNVESTRLPLEERWTLSMESLDYQTGELLYRLDGSKTGYDGSGSNFNWKYVSNSGRVAIAGDSLMINLAFISTQQKPPLDWKIYFDCVKRAVDSFRPKSSKGLESDNYQTLFISNTEKQYRLKLKPDSGMPSGIKAIRVFSPSGKARITEFEIVTEPRQLQWKIVDGSLFISWPENWSGGLQSQTNLTETQGWTPISESVQTTNATRSVLIPLNAQARLFRWAQ
jgi:hypothetical protein